MHFQDTQLIEIFFARVWKGEIVWVRNTKKSLSEKDTLILFQLKLIINALQGLKANSQACIIGGDFRETNFSSQYPCI